MKILKSIGMALVAILLCVNFTSCEKEPILTLSVQQITAPSSGNSTKVLVNANNPWTVSGNDWCTVSPSSGEVGEVSVTVTVKENTTYDARNCTLTFTSAGLTQSISVNQESNYGVVLPKNTYEISSDAQQISVEVKANIDYDITISADWIKQSGTKALTSKTYIFNVDANSTYGARDGIITVTEKNSGKSEVIKVKQAQNDAIIISSKDYNLSRDAQNIEVKLQTNVDFDIYIPDAAKDWVSHTSTKALVDKILVLDIKANDGYDARACEVILKMKNNILADTVKIYQAGGAIIMLTQNEYTVSSAGDTISVDIKSNFDFGVQMPSVDWIVDEATTKGLSSHALKYIIAPNEEYDSRSAEIIFYDKNSELKDTLRITQMQNNAILVANNEYKINSEGGILEFDVNANVDFEVSVSVDWIKQNAETRAMESKTLSFTIDEYTSLDNDREGLIIISNGELKQEIKVKQKRKIYFNFSATEVNLSSDGGKFTIEVSTNGGYTIIMPEVNWLTKGEIGNTIAYMTYANTFVASANATYESREAEIKFRNTWSDEVVFVKVKQDPYDGTYVGDITLKTKEQYKEFKKAGYKKIQGNLTIDNIAIPDTIDIKQITGNLIINCRESTTSNLGYFYNLTEIGGNLHISDNSYYYKYGSQESKVTSFDGLKNLESIGGDLKISGRVSDKVWYKDYTYGDGESGNTSHAFYNLSRMELPKLQSIGGSLIVEIKYSKVTPNTTWHRWGTRTEDYGKAFKWLKSVKFDNLSSVGEEININDIFRDRSKDDIDIIINLPY